MATETTWAQVGEEAAEAMSHFVNGMGGMEKEVFIAKMRFEHRTLQQLFTGLCLSWLYDLAERENFDLRNQASVETGKKVRELLGDYGNHLPLH